MNLNLQLGRLNSIFFLWLFFLLALFLQIPLLIILQSWPCKLDLRQIFLAVYKVMDICWIKLCPFADDSGSTSRKSFLWCTRGGLDSQILFGCLGQQRKYFFMDRPPSKNIKGMDASIWSVSYIPVAHISGNLGLEWCLRGQKRLRWSLSLLLLTLFEGGKDVTFFIIYVNVNNPLVEGIFMDLFSSSAFHCQQQTAQEC